MAIRTPRWQAVIIGLLCLYCAPAWAQSDPWYEVSKAGLQAADEGRLAKAEELFRSALKLSDPFAADDPRRALDRVGRPHQRLDLARVARRALQFEQPLTQRRGVALDLVAEQID